MGTFRTLRFGKLCWTLPGEVDASSLLPLLQEPDRFLRDPTSQIKSSGVVTIARIRGLSGVPGLILRRLNYGKLLHRIRDCFRPTRAHRAQRHSLLLHAAKIHTPRALAAGELRVFCWPRVAYLITEEIADAVTLGEMFHMHGSVPDKAIHKLAAVLAHMHERGLSNRDLKWTNILFDSKLEPWLIDLDGVRPLQHVSDHQARLDLLSLARSFPEWQNVLKAYCDERKRGDDFSQWRDQIIKMVPPE